MADVFEGQDSNLKFGPPIAGGLLFLFNRKAVRFFRKDGHEWRKKADGKTVRETHEKLKVSEALQSSVPCTAAVQKLRISAEATFTHDFKETQLVTCCRLETRRCSTATMLIPKLKKHSR